MKRDHFFLLAACMCTLFLVPNAYSSQIEFIREIGDPGKKAGQQRFTAPRALAMGLSKIYVADTDAHRVVVLDQTGRVLQMWGGRGSDPGRLGSPSGIALDEDGRVYVADTKNNRIQVFRASGAFLRSIGEKGSGALEFSNPSGIAVRKGLVYVADSGNGRVQVMTTEGIFMRSITAQGQSGEMKNPIAVAVDSQNRIYTIDKDDDRVRVFDQKGAQLREFGKSGKGAEKLDSPQGIAVDNLGNIYIADAGNNKVKMFDQNGRLLASQGSRGDGPGQFRQMFGMAISKSSLYVLDAERNSIQVFSCEGGEDGEGEGNPPDVSPLPTVSLYKEIRGAVTGLAFDKQPWALVGNQIRMVGAAGDKPAALPGREPGKLRNPQDLAFDASGKVWVADTENNRLQKFSVDGKLLQVIGKSGSHDGEFDAPAGIVVGANGNVYVADTGNKRVQIFTANGMFVSAFGRAGAGRFSEPVGIAVDGSDCLYVVDRGNDRLAKYSASGKLLWEIRKSGSGDGEFKAPASIVLSPDGDLYVLDAGNARVQVFNTEGRFLWKFGSEGKNPGQFKSPHGLALEGNLHLYVGDRGNDRVQVFSLHQTPAMPIEVTAEARPGEVYVSWRGPRESYLEQYSIYRGDAESGPFRLIKKQTAQRFIDRDLPSRRTYYYRVSSMAKDGYESMASEAVFVVTPKLVPSLPGKLKLEAGERQMKLSWPQNGESIPGKYNVYRSSNPALGFELIATVDKNAYLDSGLDDGAVYYYRVTAVGKEGDESLPGEAVSGSTQKPSATRPPLEITKVEMKDIFSSMYRQYESHPVGRVIVTNNTDHSFRKVKVFFSVKDFMDYPTEAALEQVLPKQQVEITLKPIFNNKIFEVKDNTPVQSEIALIFYSESEAKTIKSTVPLMLYERHAVVWDQIAKLGTFVTLKDPLVVEFTRAAIKKNARDKKNVSRPIAYARAVYEALGALRMKYLANPSSSFEEGSSKKAGSVDYLQYPRETLSKKSGGSVDLSVLFAACLEDLGIQTAFIYGPGHLFVMFDTGVNWEQRSKLGLSPNSMVHYEKRAWVPVEMTLVGKPFAQALQKGSEKYYEWAVKGQNNIIGTHKAWELFRPVSIPARKAGGG